MSGLRDLGLLVRLIVLSFGLDFELKLPLPERDALGRPFDRPLERPEGDDFFME